MSPSTLPEGTDTILGDSAIDTDSSEATPIPGSTAAGAQSAGDASGTAQGGTSSGPASASEAYRAARDQAGQKAQELKGQAADKLRAYAVGGKDKATETIQGFAKTIDDVASQIDEKVGAQYGDYARQAAQTLAGFASTIEGKDVDELFEQARDAVRKSPAIAVGAAAALGFVLARVVKAGADATAGAATEKDVTFTPDPASGTGENG